MSIRVTCPNGHVLHVKEKYAGQTGLCPKCKERVLVPQVVSDEAIVDMLGPPAERTESDSLPVHQEERDHDPNASSSGRLLGSSILSDVRKICPKCRTEVKACFDLCPKCGLYFTDWSEIHRRLHERCPRCGTQSNRGDVRCRQCDADLRVGVKQ